MVDTADKLNTNKRKTFYLYIYVLSFAARQGVNLFNLLVH